MRKSLAKPNSPLRVLIDEQFQNIRESNSTPAQPASASVGNSANGHINMQPLPQDAPSSARSSMREDENDPLMK